EVSRGSKRSQRVDQAAPAARSGPLLDDFCGKWIPSRRQKSLIGQEAAAKLELRPRDRQFWGRRINPRTAVPQDVPIGSGPPSLVALNDRSREIFRQIVDSYLATGEPVGSRNLARLISRPLSPASVRNVMQDLEELGLIYAPHTSAGRLPTERGLRFFVDALMQVGDLTERDRSTIEGQVAAAGTSVEKVLNEASG